MLVPIVSLSHSAGIKSSLQNFILLLFTSLLTMATEVTTDQSEIFDPSELYYLCEDEEPGGSLEGINQWINNNKNNNKRLKAAATYQGEFDETPLHLILNKYKGNTPLDIIERFIESVPEAIQMKDQYGCLPIHDAVRTDPVSLKVLQALVNSYPESVKVAEICGWLPLHYACTSDQLEVINFLIKSYPESVKVADDYGFLPLHIACENASSMEIIQALVNSYPASVRVIDSKGYLPLHSALFGLAKFVHEISLEECEALNFLIESYPEGTDQKNKYGRTPLDMYSSNFDMVTDKNGMLLLHHACISGNYVHLIHFLIQAQPESSSAPDNNEKTPLQYLKETASCKDERGMLLLHREVAHSKGLSVKILSFLFDAYPEAVRVQDNAGLLPIHHACLNETSSLDIIMSLVKLYPESIVV